MDTSLFALSIDQWIVVTFLVATLIVGIVSGLKIKTVRDYTIGEKGSFPTSVLAMTLIATMIGGTSTIGSVSEFFKHGYVYALTMFGYIIGIIMLAVLVSPRFDKRFDGMLSSADIVGKFYGDKAEKFTGVIGTLFGIGAIGAQITALASLGSNFINIDYTFSVLMVGSIMVIYSSFGGIRSVAITDVMQFLILAVGIPIIANLCFRETGSFHSMIFSLPETHTKFFEHEDFLEHIASCLFYMLPLVMLQPALVQRYLMANDSNQITKITYLYAFLALSLGIMAACIAFTSVQLFPEIEPNTIIPNANQ